MAVAGGEPHQRLGHKPGASSPGDSNERPYIPRSFSPTHWLLVAIANRLGRPADRQDRTIILDPLTGECLGEAALHPFLYEAEQAFSPCGRWFASGMSEECPHEMDEPVPAGTVLVTDLGSILSQASPAIRGRE